MKLKPDIIMNLVVTLLGFVLTALFVMDGAWLPAAICVLIAVMNIVALIMRGKHTK